MLRRLSALGIGLVAIGVALQHSTAAQPHAQASDTVRSVAASRPFESTAGDRALEVFNRTPLTFERSDTSSDEFVARAPGYLLEVRATGATLSFGARDTREPSRDRAAVPDAHSAARIGIELVGATIGPHRSSTEDSPGRANYLFGSRPDGWRTDVPLYSRVKFQGVYPGIDVVYYGNQRSIEYDFLVEPGARPEQIALGFNGVTSVSLDADGAALLDASPHAVRLEAPVAYQDTQAGRQTVDVRYTIRGSHHLAIAVGAYNHALPLVIDPVLSYSTFVGGSGEDEATAVAIDSAGNIYLAGTTVSPNFPVQSPAQGTGGGHGDVFIAKISATTGAPVYSTFLGGSGPDEAGGLAIDGAGNVYVTGTTGSPDLPVANALQAGPGGATDAFVAKLNAGGSGLVYSTYLGGIEIDEAHGLAVDAAGSAYVAGVTLSWNFPVQSAAQPNTRGATDAFVTKLTPTGQTLAFSTFLGGTGSDSAFAIAVDPSGSAFVTGSTASPDFPTASAVQPAYGGGIDAFVTRFTSSGTGFHYSTFLGGTALDSGQAIAAAPDGTAVIVGSTAAPNFPVVGPIFAQHGGGLDAFLTVIAPTPSVTASTFLGGAGSDRARAVTLDTASRIYVAGQTTSTDFPTVGASQPVHGGSRDAFLALFGYSPAGLVLGWTTYFGNGNNEDALALAVDAAGRIYLTGAMTYNAGEAGGSSDAFVTRMSNGDGVSDTDGDGIPNEWETQFRLDPLANDAAADADGDGLTNLQEYQAGSHPRGSVDWYFAEGATGTFFADTLAIANPSASSAAVLFRFLTRDGSVISKVVQMEPYSRATLDAQSVPGLADAEFSTIVEADARVIVDRTMTWAATGSTLFYGSHAETAIDLPALTWYLAEGATQSTFDLFYLIQNPGGDTADVEVTYLLPNGPPIKQTYAVPPHSRFNIWVDEQPGLNNTDVSAKIESRNNVPILVERAMYKRTGSLKFGAGHASAGITSPQTKWFLAEGATGNYFDLFVLIANPNTSDAQVRATYLMPDGSTIVKEYVVGAEKRFNIWVDLEEGLSNTAVSTIVESLNGVPIIVERAMWWPGPTSSTWTEAHNSFGSTETGTKWALAEGTRGGTRKIETYILIANTSEFPGDIQVTLYFEDDGTKSERLVGVAAKSRFNVNVAEDFPEATGRRFAAVVESVGAQPAQLVVERAMYSNSGNTVWAAGTNALATKLQ